MYAFIILHYLAEEMTKDCVNCLEKYLDMRKCRIVIVDNASSNGSGKKLQEYYKNTKYCDVIVNNENVGFARGNNIGYKYAKEHYNPNYMIIMNNDVLIEDDEFLDQIEKIHSETRFDVLGPDIISKKTGMHQNPVRKESVSAQQIKKEIARCEKFMKSPKVCFVIDKVKKTIREVKKTIRIRTRLKNIFTPPHSTILPTKKSNAQFIHCQQQPKPKKCIFKPNV